MSQLAVILCAVLIATVTGQGIPAPSRFLQFLQLNVIPNGGIPLSYDIQPVDYFAKVPANLRPQDYTQPMSVIQCGGENASAAALNAYEFQSEQLLSALGLNIYDGAVRCIALTLLGQGAACRAYTANTLLKHKTIQFPDFRADASCKGIISRGTCVDKMASGACGLCYGDVPATQSQDVNHAYFMRMISDYWAIQGTIDARCPDKAMMWTWNDYKPILGENAWANLLGPLVSYYNMSNGNVNAMDDASPELVLATTILTALDAMKVGTLGAFYYCPRNTWFSFNASLEYGSTVSTENQASLLAGLKALRYVIATKTTSTYKGLLPQIEGYITGLQTFLLSAYDPSVGYFRQGGTYDAVSKTFQWHQGIVPGYATDCQTWVGSVLGPNMIDAALGAGTSFNLWQTVKATSGYEPRFGMVKGVGYTTNDYNGQVFSGEWTFGAINWLFIMQNNSTYTQAQKDELGVEANYMRSCIESELVQTLPVQKTGTSAPSVLYSNIRYYIPFGWWANDIPATSSTAWAVAVDLKFNPFMLDGSYTSDY